MQPTRHDVFMFYDSQVSVISSDYGKRLKGKYVNFSTTHTLVRIHVVLTDKIASVEKLLVQTVFLLDSGILWGESQSV